MRHRRAPDSTTAGGISEGRRRLTLAGIAAVFGAILYLNSVPNGFVFDDRPIVERNTQIRSLTNLPEIFRTPYNRYFGEDAAGSGLYRPLTIASFALNHALDGLRPEGYHLVNVVLHALASGLVVLVALALTLPVSVALAGGLLFAVHPIHTEAVANVTGRAELLSAVFFLAALLGYVRGRKAGAAVLFLLALLSKENSFALLGVVAAWEVLLRPRCGEPSRGKSWVDSARSLCWLFVPALLVLAIRAAVLGSSFSPPPTTPFVDNPLVNADLVTRSMTATAVAARYAWLLVFPWRLSPDYSWAQIVPVASFGDVAFLAGLALAIVIAGVLFRFTRHAPKLAFLGFLALLPFSLVSNFPAPIGTIMAERLLYLPSVGFCLLAGSLWPWLRTQLGKGPAWAVSVAILGVLSARTAARNIDWHDGYRLFSKAAITSPRSAKVWNNLGSELLKRDRVPEAKEALLKARQLAPDWPNTRITLAQVYLAEGSAVEAEIEARMAVGALPASPLALFKLGEVLEAQGKFRAAAKAYAAGLALDPDDFDAKVRLGQVSTATGDFSTAERELLAAVSERPTSVPARVGLGLCYQGRGRHPQAVEQLTEAARLDPSSIELKNNLGNALRLAGRLEESMRVLEEARVLNESFAPTQYNLGLVLEQMGRVDEARSRYLRALEIRATHEGSLCGMARLALRSKDAEGALRFLTLAIDNHSDSKEGLALRARAYFELARYDEAERDLVRLLELDPNATVARDNLERIRALKR